MLKSPTFPFSQSPLHISTRNLLPQIESTGGGDNRSGVNPVRNPSRFDSKPSGALNPALRGGTRNYSKTPLQPPAQPPAQKSLWLGERASLRGMSPSGAEPGPEGAAGFYF